MSQSFCPSCSKELAGEFRFCPHCGYEMQKPIVCPNCQYANESNSKFCQECGTPLRDVLPARPQGRAKATESRTSVVEIEPPSSNGITIEFPYSSAQTFDFAVECAKQFPTFRQYGEDKKAVYRVTFDSLDMASALELVDYLKGWRRRVVYVDGEKVTWDSVFSFAWCYERKKASFKPEFYCFGYENEYEFNIWGCTQAHLPFTENSQWFCWGSWLNNRGDWRFDKEHIRHELQKALYQYRYCTALQPELVEDVLNALPDVINPNKDKNWKFVERWGDESLPGLVVTVSHFGFQEKVVMRGVAPNGQGALKDIEKRMKHRLPPWR